MVCQFEAAFLEVPAECLILTMKANQKYFPLLDQNGQLINKFLIVSNINPADASSVIRGNERVVRPRLSDAQFFFDQDRKKTLESRVEGLSKVVYHNKLGTQAERSERVTKLATYIATRLGFDAALAERLLVIAEQDLVWLEATAKAVENRYRNGTAALADTLQIQNEVSQRANALRSDRLHLAHYHLALNRLLGRPASNSWPVFELPPVTPSVPYSAKLLSLTFAREPRLRVQDWQVRQAAATAEATHKMRLPDVSLGVEGRQFSDDGGFRSGMMTLRVSFPWFNRTKYQKDYERDLAKKQAAEQMPAAEVLAVHKKWAGFRAPAPEKPTAEDLEKKKWEADEKEGKDTRNVTVIEGDGGQTSACKNYLQRHCHQRRHQCNNDKDSTPPKGDVNRQ
jgi:hypothetical protein